MVTMVMIPTSRYVWCGYAYFKEASFGCCGPLSVLSAKKCKKKQTKKPPGSLFLQLCITDGTISATENDEFCSQSYSGHHNRGD